jgi:predicted Rossmann fold nucleotide-binding protein DprA/Smf involved in DNA uptake
MKDVKKELASISTALTSLTKKVERMVMTLEKESGKAAPKKKAKAAKKAAAAPKKKAPAKKAKVPAKKKAAPKASSKAKAPAASGSETMLDNILGMISRSRSGITVDKLKKRTDLEARQVSNALYKLSRKGLVETIARGVYVKKKK